MVEQPTQTNTNANAQAEQTNDSEFSYENRSCWDKMSTWYTRFERYELPSVISCVELTGLSSKSGPVLEVGCGPGLQSETIAKGFLRGQGSLLVSCDFSTEMVKMMSQRYAASAFGRQDGQKAIINTETDYASCDNTDVVDLQGISAANQPYERLVYGCIADNMRLPFADGTFEAYISNLSLMIVQHRERQISEAYRVLKPGSRACFTIWGREENCLQFSIRKKCFVNLGREPPKGDDDRYYALSDDHAGIKKMCTDAGFEDVRLWYQPCNWYFKDGDDYWQNFSQRIPKNYMDDALKAEAIRLFNEALSEMRVFEKLVILVHKNN